MSAPVAANVLRELGAERRTFRSLKQAMLTYRDQLSNKLSVSRDLASAGSPRSREFRDRAQATFAAIARCIGPKHWSDATLKSQGAIDALPINGERICYLVAWYENTYGNGEDLARRWRPDDEEDPRWRFIRWCRTTERVLRHRMEAEGLLEG